jgi:hypothetical protein
MITGAMIDMEIEKKRHYYAILLSATGISIIHSVIFSNFFGFSFLDFLEFSLLGYYLAMFRFDGELIPYMSISLILMYFGCILTSHRKSAIVLFLIGFELMLIIGIGAASVLI